MQLPWQRILFKIKSYWRLFFQRMPTLRNATGLGLLIGLGFYCIRFDQPLDFDFNKPVSKIEFIRADQLDQLALVSASLELFDTAPLYIPTQWNFSSSVRPIHRGLNQSDFTVFEPEIDFKDALNMDMRSLNKGDSDFGTIVPDAGFDPRLLTLFVTASNEPHPIDRSDHMANLPTIQANLHVDVLRVGQVNSGEDFERVLFSYKLDTEAIPSNLNPVIVLLANDRPFPSVPKIYQSSASESFDQAILDWLKNPSHSQSLPKGYLKLTFYPY